MQSYSTALIGVFFKSGATRAVHQLLVADPSALVVTTIAGIAGGAAVSVHPDADAAFGAQVSAILRRERLVGVAQHVLETGAVGRQLADILVGWLAAKDDPVRCSEALAFADQWLVREAGSNPGVKELYERMEELPKRSRWIVIADTATSEPLRPALHLAVSAGRDIKLLVCVTDPVHDPRDASTPPGVDAGLYALNYGGAYVASTSPGSHPSQFAAAVAGTAQGYAE
jgi:hypothetical protein